MPFALQQEEMVVVRTSSLEDTAELSLLSFLWIQKLVS
jgi:hypothetical protein